MNDYFIPIKSVFQNEYINVLDIESGLEFLAEDILKILGVDKLNITQALDLVKNLSTNRSVLIDGELYEKQSLNWLALKQVFNKFDYDGKKDFNRWIRKSLTPALALNKNEDSVNDKISGANKLDWYFIGNEKSIETIVSNYQSKLISYIGLFSEFDTVCHTNCIVYSKYLKLLKKELYIPNYDILITSDLASRLLRQRYLESISPILGVNNLDYLSLYNAFITSRNHLLTAQELDIALLYAFKEGSIPYFMLQIVEGGIFLQSLLSCTLYGSIDKSISLQIKQSYISWLHHIYLKK